jgi:hypothetical protein
VSISTYSEDLKNVTFHVVCLVFMFLCIVFDYLREIVTVPGLDRGPLSLVNTTGELLDGKIAAPVYKTENTAVGIRHADHVAPSIRKSWQSLRRQAAVARSV